MGKTLKYLASVLSLFTLYHFQSCESGEKQTTKTGLQSAQQAKLVSSHLQTLPLPNICFALKNLILSEALT